MSNHNQGNVRCKCGAIMNRNGQAKARNFLTFHGKQTFIALMWKCMECGTCIREECDLVPKYSRYGWDIIHAVVAMHKLNGGGFVPLSDMFHAEYDIRICASALCKMWNKYGLEGGKS